MTRLIDADALKELMIEVLEHIKENPKMDGQEKHIIAGIHMLGEMIDDAPTVDAEPVRYGRWKKAEPHGVWVYSDAYRQCSECNAVIYRALKMSYCPNCGARMVGGEW